MASHVSRRLEVFGEEPLTGVEAGQVVVVVVVTEPLLVAAREQVGARWRALRRRHVTRRAADTLLSMAGGISGLITKPPGGFV